MVWQYISILLACFVAIHFISVTGIYQPYGRTAVTGEVKNRSGLSKGHVELKVFLVETSGKVNCSTHTIELMRIERYNWTIVPEKGCVGVSTWYLSCGYKVGNIAQSLLIGKLQTLLTADSASVIQATSRVSLHYQSRLPWWTVFTNLMLS